ncbi:MAG: hypothetical protein COA44_06170 [Arcobacter sp.]|nr:MAG: hypothetical protein COA44_06170 [Arcobacter sp.]
MGLKLKTASTSLPVDLVLAKAHLNILDNQEDFYITSLIEAATNLAEEIMGRQIVSAVYELTMDVLPVCFELPRPELISVDIIQYIAPEDTLFSTLDASLYIVDDTNMIGEVSKHPDISYPSVRAIKNSVKVTYTTGYKNQSSVPAAIKHWILLQVGTWYEHREEVVVGVSSTSIKNKYNDMLLNMYKLVKI